MNQRLAQLRRDYEALGLSEDRMAADPLDEFARWFGEVEAAGLEEPNAFVLATADASGRPSARAVLLKDLDVRGLVFYTNMESRKSEELRANPRAAATFVWIPIHRQVRFEGTAEPVAPEEADRYFATRPRGAQIAAHASPQSRVVGAKAELEAAFNRLESDYAGQEVPRPGTWGGWRLDPETVEFWQGQPNRFHDRIRYRRQDGGWRRERLAP